MDEKIEIEPEGARADMRSAVAAMRTRLDTMDRTCGRQSTSEQESSALNKLVALAALCLLPCLATATTVLSSSAKAEFKREHPCPATRARSGACGGYVIDHIMPLACGGADTPGNMQGQTIAEAKATDKWKLQSCRK